MKKIKCVTLSFYITIEQAEEFDRILELSEYPVNRSALLRKLFLEWLKERQQKPVGDENCQG